MVRIDRASLHSKRQASGEKQGWIERPGSSFITENLLQQLQKGIAGIHATVELSDGFAAVPDPLTFQQDRPFCQSITTSGQFRSKGMVASTIADGEFRQSPLKFGPLCECTAERAAAVVNEGQFHSQIVPCLP